MSRDYEALSAFLDGETSEFETHRVLRDVRTDDLDTLSRWQLARDLMHGQATRAVPPAFNVRLCEALAAEARPGRRSGVIGGFARAAVAASVAAATVIGWQYWNTPGQAGLATAPAIAASNGTGAANDAGALPAAAGQRLTPPFGQTSLVAQDFLQPRALQPRADTRTVRSTWPWGNAMLLRHSEFAARHGGQGMMPYARLISLDARNGAE